MEYNLPKHAGHIQIHFWDDREFFTSTYHHGQQHSFLNRTAKNSNSFSEELFLTRSQGTVRASRHLSYLCLDFLWEVFIPHS